MTGVKEKEETQKPKPIQSQTDQDIAGRVFQSFLKWRDNRNKSFNYFRNRSCYDYWDDSNKRFNNYRVRPDWKEEWQANTSDTTTHAKLMAVVAQQVVNRYKAIFRPRFNRDIFSQLRAQILQDIYNFTDTEVRNGEMDTLFTVLKAAREGTVIGFEGYKKTKLFEGIDSRFIPLEEYYPSDMTKFNIKDDLKKIWRTVITKDDFDEGFQNWYQRDKVKTRAEATANEELSFFNITDDIENDQVEILRYFDKLNDEFFITANGVLIVNPNSQGWKLTDRRKDKEDGMWKTVFEAFDNFFFYGRSLPDLMQDAQDGIDFLFNAMFDKEILAVLRPMLSGSINQETDDYMYPGKITKVADVDQFKEMPVSPPDLTSFRVLKELQDRQHFISVDQVSQGVSMGKKTATEVERAQESAQKLNSVFGVMIKDALNQKAHMRAGIILQYLIKSKKYSQFIIENIKMIGNGKLGTRIIRIKEKLASADKAGYSKQLAAENALIKGEREIWELSPKEIEDFEYSITTESPTTIEVSPALQRAYDLQWVMGARGNPQYDQESVERIHTQAMNKDWEEVKAKEQQKMPMPGEPGAEGGKQLPQLQGAMPQL